MKWRYRILLIAVSLMLGLDACRKYDPKEPSENENTPCENFHYNPSGFNVSFDLARVPYSTLSEYAFFVDTISNLHPNAGVLPYDVITPLFSDYAKKKRFIWMPCGTSAQYTSDREVVDFPEGTVMIKNFYYDNVQPSGNRKIIETRLIYKKNGEWKFADYVWNDEQTEATYDLNGSYQDIEWMDTNGEIHSVNYRIPSEAECKTCHKIVDVATPIGPKPQNLNKSINYEDGASNQLAKWAAVGYLNADYPSSIETVVDWTDVNQSVENRWRAYVDMNCAHCHREGSHCSYRPLRLAWSETANPDNLGVCITPQENVPGAPQLTKIIARGSINRSMMHFRLNTTQTEYRMPLLGRSVVHEEAITLLEDYINSLTTPCP
jgi:uncharacterized repeat protein (TIGR03806 family)